jgi:hypothetical protein
MHACVRACACVQAVVCLISEGCRADGSEPELEAKHAIAVAARSDAQPVPATADADDDDAVDDTLCRVCHSAAATHEVFGEMLLCDWLTADGTECDAGYHLKCLPTPLDAVPSGPFYCPMHRGDAVGDADGDAVGDLRVSPDVNTPTRPTVAAAEPGADGAVHTREGRRSSGTAASSADEPRPTKLARFESPQRAGRVQ